MLQGRGYFKRMVEWEAFYYLLKWEFWPQGWKDYTMYKCTLYIKDLNETEKYRVKCAALPLFSYPHLLFFSLKVVMSTVRCIYIWALWVSVLDFSPHELPLIFGHDKQHGHGHIWKNANCFARWIPRGGNDGSKSMYILHFVREVTVCFSERHS